jgi:hypothetical protein
MKRNPFRQIVEHARELARQDAVGGAVPVAGESSATVLVEGALNGGPWQPPGMLDVTLLSGFRLAAGTAGGERG